MRSRTRWPTRACCRTGGAICTRALPRRLSGLRPTAWRSNPSGWPTTPCTGNCGKKRSPISTRRGSAPWHAVRISRPFLISSRHLGRCVICPRPDIRMEIRNALFPFGDWVRMGEYLQEAEMLARSLGDQHRLGRIATCMVTQRRATGDHDGAFKFGQEALTIARTLGDRSIEVVAMNTLGATHLLRGEYREAAKLL